MALAAHAQAQPQAVASGKPAPAELPAKVEDELWNAIKGSERTKVFREYIKQFPAGRYLAQATERLAALGEPVAPAADPAPAAESAAMAGNDPETALWRVVVQADGSSGYGVYLQQYAKGKYAFQAKRRLQIVKDDEKWQAEAAELHAWQTAELEKSAAGYAAYLGRYPGGQFAAQAQTRYDALSREAVTRDEDYLWKLAVKGPRPAVAAYLQRYPKGRYAAAATARMAHIEREEQVAASPGKTFRDCPTCPEMIVLPGGSFRMGGDGGKPVHTVTIARPFALAKTEVTQSQWLALMGSNPSQFADCKECPVDGVSWDDAQAYVDKLSAMTGKVYRLPSEAEWEYACRAGGQSTYCGGDDIDRVAWHGAPIGNGNADRKTHPVAQKDANAFGFHDMSGNLWEWVEDCYQDSYKDAPTDGSAWVKDGCASRVLRGGSWLSEASYARATSRLPLAPKSRGSSYGLRPAWRLP
jgi:formylglycine-generating enzyme required for sulfatase activity